MTPPPLTDAGGVERLPVLGTRAGCWCCKAGSGLFVDDRWRKVGPTGSMHDNTSTSKRPPVPA